MESQSSLKSVLVPTFRQAAGCLAASLLVIGFVYRTQIWHRLSQDSLSKSLKNINYGDSLSSITNSPILHTAVIVLFWGGVGLVAYTLIWSLINVVIEARNEIVLETTYTNRSNFNDRLHTPLLQIGLAIALFAGLFLTAKFGLPYWLNLAFMSVNAVSLLLTIGYGLAAVLGLATNIYVLIMLGQLVFWVG